MSRWRDVGWRTRTRHRFEERMAIPVLVAAALLTAVTLVLLLAELSKRARLGLLAVDAVIWAFFAFDYVVRFTLATPKRRFVREEWLDLVLVVMPLLQPLRLAGALVRLARLSAALDRTASSAERLLGRHKLYLAMAWAAGLVLIASIITPLVEADNAKIKTFGDGVWWAVVTTTTVGYGDLVPESSVGRAIGFLLMLAGVGIIGLLTANIASMLMEPPPPDEDAGGGGAVDRGSGRDGIEVRLDELEAKLDEILQRLEDRRGQGAG